MNEILNHPISLGHHSCTLLALLEFALEFIVFLSINIGIVKWLKQSKYFSRLKKSIIKTAITIFVWMIALPIMGATLGISITAFLAIDAALLVGFGIGFRGIFTDIVSGYVIHIEGSILQGDIVEYDNEIVKVKGTNLRSMRFQNLSGEDIIVPNSSVAEKSIVNLNKGRLTRIQVDIGVAYGSDIELVEKILLEAISGHDEIKLSLKEPQVLFNDYGSSSLKFSVYGWINDPWNKMIIQSKIRLSINSKFRSNGIVIPFPQRDIHIKNNEQIPESTMS